MSMTKDEIERWKDDGRTAHQISFMCLIVFVVSGCMLAYVHYFGWPGLENAPIEFKPWLDHLYTVLQWGFAGSALAWISARLVVVYALSKLQKASDANS